MARWKLDGRSHAQELVALAERRADGAVTVRSPGVGLWRGAPAPGSLVAGGTVIGQLEVLGVLHRLVAPGDAHGVVIAEESRGLRRARVPVGYGEVLLVLDPRATVGAGSEAGAAAEETTTGLVFRAPSSGRFYVRPAPDKPAFVADGDEVRAGQTLALLEVMKTFNRIHYGGDGLPDPARIVRTFPEDGSDVDEGEPLFEVEPA